MFTLTEETKIVQALNPAADAAGRTGVYVTAKNAGKVNVVVSITQGNAAVVPITIEQAQAVAGTGSKVITKAVQIWANLDSGASDTLVRQADGVNFSTDAGIKNKVVVFQIDPRTLDIDNGFDCIVVKTGASNVANITAATYVLTDLRYGQAIPTSAVVD